jgi:hypothetical protein
MKKLLFIPMLLIFHFAFAGTGGAKDDDLFLLSICGILLFIVAVGYSIDYIKKIIRQRRSRKLSSSADDPYKGDISQGDLIGHSGQ